MIEHFLLTVRCFIYLILKAKCRSSHLNENLLNIAISHGLHRQSLHHNPHHHHQHQHQGNLKLMKPQLLLWCQQRSLRSFIMNKECSFLCSFFDMFNAKLTQRLKLGTLSIDKGDGIENITFKLNWCFFQLCVYSNLLKISNVRKFPWSWFLWDCTQV